MMSFEVPYEVLDLKYDKYPGLSVQASSISLGNLLDLIDEADDLRAGNVSKARRLFDAFGANLRTWNCTKDGQPLPATVEALYALSSPFATTIILGWYDAIAGDGDDPLDQRSTSGAPSATVPFVPTEVL